MGGPFRVTTSGEAVPAVPVPYPERQTTGRFSLKAWLGAAVLGLLIGPPALWAVLRVLIGAWETMLLDLKGWSPLW